MPDISLAVADDPCSLASQSRHDPCPSIRWFSGEGIQGKGKLIEF